MVISVQILLAYAVPATPLINLSWFLRSSPLILDPDKSSSRVTIMEGAIRAVDYVLRNFKTLLSAIVRDSEDLGSTKSHGACFTFT